mgnify:CR=1 FL=1
MDTNRSSQPFWRNALGAGVCGLMLVVAITGCTPETYDDPPAPRENAADARPQSQPAPRRVRSKDSVPKEDWACDDAWRKIDKDVEGARTLERLPLPVPSWAKDLMRLHTQTLAEQKRSAENAASSGLTQEAYDQFVDEMAQELVRALPNTPPPTGFTRVLVVNDIAVDDKMPRHVQIELQAALDALVVRLAKNEVIQQRYAIVDMNSAQAKKITEQVSGDDPGYFDDPLGRNPANADQVKYHPNDVYVLGANLYLNDRHVERRHRLTYHLNFKVDHARSRQKFAGQVFSREYRFQPYRKQWLSAADYDAMRAVYTRGATASR